MTPDLEEGATLSLDFAKLASVADSQELPCAVQDSTTNEVILVAYMNERARAATCRRNTIGGVLEHVARRAVGEGSHLGRDV